MRALGYGKAGVGGIASFLAQVTSSYTINIPLYTGMLTSYRGIAIVALSLNHAHICMQAITPPSAAALAAALDTLLRIGALAPGDESLTVPYRHLW